MIRLCDDEQDSDFVAVTGSDKAEKKSLKFPVARSNFTDSCFVILLSLYHRPDMKKNKNFLAKILVMDLFSLVPLNGLMDAKMIHIAIAINRTEKKKTSTRNQ